MADDWNYPPGADGPRAPWNQGDPKCRECGLVLFNDPMPPSDGTDGWQDDLGALCGSCANATVTDDDPHECGACGDRDGVPVPCSPTHEDAWDRVRAEQEDDARAEWIAAGRPRSTAIDRMASGDPVGFYLACKDHPETLPED